MTNHKNRQRNRDPRLCKHNLIICSECVQASDAAKRFSDGVNAMIAFHDAWELKNHWLAIGLQDGSVASDVYETREEAMKSQHGNEAWYFYMPVGNFLQGLKLLDAEMILQFQRMAYDAGIRVTDTPTSHGQGADPFLSIPGADRLRDMVMRGKIG